MKILNKKKQGTKQTKQNKQLIFFYFLITYEYVKKGKYCLNCHTKKLEQSLIRENLYLS